MWIRSEVTQRETIKREAEATMVQATVEWKMKRAQYLAAQEALDAQKALDLAVKAEEKVREQETKRQWIESYGSSFLKQAFTAGYDWRRYVLERAAMELPGYTVDIDDNAGWDTESDPSESAFGEAERLQALGYDSRVAWLTGGVDDNALEPGEAVVVCGYLGHYDLIRSEDLG